MASIKRTLRVLDGNACWHGDSLKVEYVTHSWYTVFKSTSTAGMTTAMYKVA